jgi:hypothetical protein
VADEDGSKLDRLRYMLTCHDKEKADLQALNAYYEGEQPLSYMAPELIQELDDRVRQVVVNWPRLVVDSLEERLDVEGFRFGSQADADRDLWRIWQANGLDEESQQGHLDALVMRRSFVFVGTRAKDARTPLITVESPLECFAEFDPQTRMVERVSKHFTEGDGKDKLERASLREKNETSWFLKHNGRWVEDPDNPPDEHGLGEVPAAVLANRPRLMRRGGVSELRDVIPLSDAACKIATDMMISAEFHAIPRRYAIGVAPEDFEDEEGRKISALRRIAGRIWAIGKDRTQVELGQFPEANLKNFHDTIGQLAELVAALAGLPPHFLGFTSANPASADAIRSSEARLIKRAERKQRAWGGSWEQAMRIALRFRDGEWAEEALSLETIWRDASTPTIAQKADASQKLFEAKIVPLRQTREDLNYTAVQIDRMEAEDAKAADSAVQRILAGDMAALVGPKPPEPAQPEVPGVDAA